MSIDRNTAGQFTRGNSVARKSGLYSRCCLNATERKRVGQVRRYLRDAGLPDDVAANQAIAYLNSTRVIEDYTRIEDPAERLAKFDILERATRIQTGILDRRDRALARSNGQDQADDVGAALVRAIRIRDEKETA